jgi:hypothetical protein
LTTFLFYNNLELDLNKPGICTMKASRKEAIEALEKFYYTGKPCKHGHLSKRYTIEGVCFHCVTVKRAEERKRLRLIFAESNIMD